MPSTWMYRLQPEAVGGIDLRGAVFPDQLVVDAGGENPAVEIRSDDLPLRAGHQLPPAGAGELNAAQLGGHTGQADLKLSLQRNAHGENSSLSLSGFYSSYVHRSTYY